MRCKTAFSEVLLKTETKCVSNYPKDLLVAQMLTHF